MSADTIRVTVVCAEPDRQTVLPLVLAAGTTAAEALECSGIFALHPDLGPGCAIGVWGREVAPGRVLAEGDRVEVLRPLAQDPRERRRRLARAGGAQGKGSAFGR